MLQLRCTTYLSVFSSTPDSRILTNGRRCCMKPHFHLLNLPRHEESDVIYYLSTFVAFVNITPAVEQPEWLGPSQPEACGRQHCSHVHNSWAEPLHWSRKWRGFFLYTVSNTGSTFEQEWTMSPIAPYGRWRERQTSLLQRKYPAVAAGGEQPLREHNQFRQLNLRAGSGMNRRSRWRITPLIVRVW